MNDVLKSITGTTVIALGITFSLACNNSFIVEGNDCLMPAYKMYSDNPEIDQNNLSYAYADKNIYIESKDTRLERIASETFGVMRDASKEETEGINRYINTISKETGVDFFSAC